MLKSTPTQGSGCDRGAGSATSTSTEANHRSASRLTVTRRGWPRKRSVSRILTEPTRGSLMRWLSQTEVPTSLTAQKPSRTPRRLKRGKRPRLSKKDLNAAPRSMMASCTAHLVTSSIQG